MSMTLTGNYADDDIGRPLSKRHDKEMHVTLLKAAWELSYGSYSSRAEAVMTAQNQQCGYELRKHKRTPSYHDALILFKNQMFGSNLGRKMWSRIGTWSEHGI
jgi:hypothetical protein